LQTLTETQHLLVPLGSASLLALLFLYIFRRKQENYLLYWAVAWTLLALRSLIELFWMGENMGPPLAQSVDALLLALAALMFLDSALVYSRGATTPTATAYLVPIFVLWQAARWAYPGALAALPLELGSAMVMIATAVLLLQDSRRREIVGGTLLAVAFLLWGSSIALRPWTSALAPLPMLILAFLNTLPRLLVGFSQFIVLFEEEKRTLERHMLGLAGLNLITSTAQHAATVQDMLGQTLERLQGALRVPVGAIGLSFNDTSPLHCIHRGENPFLRELDRVSLLPYLHRTVVRLGGLVVLPDLNSQGIPAPFTHEEEFQQIVRVAQSEGIRLLVGVSLRSKSGDRGVLLLASPNARRFTPAELRLLLGLGGQVGMAVENFHLLQQTARRTEELRLLNDIGRVLSSVRNVDDLLERIYSEIQRVLDVRNFYIALFDPQKEEVLFELEVRDAAFLPKRRRRARNGLTEYVLRQKQPVLIRENFDDVVRRLGIEPGRPAQCFCAVPILLHGEAVGVMGIISYDQTRVFDQQHVDILTILAAQAAVAIENARLFGAEQKRGRQLTLLNNITRCAISTFNPEEMLTAIAAEMHAGLAYDYIGLGVLDYASREVIIQAEGTQGAHGLNRRFKLGVGSLGRVAQSGALEQVDNVAELPHPDEVHAILPDSQALITLPIVYADQLLGVLTVESRRAYSFHEEDVLLLRTLADQVASALHNAFVFQKAQEQAITDGLTGVKTHRFFMEGMNTEWRRATRVGRSFSLLLLDLDKFKFVNDYFGHLEGDTVLQRVGRILEQNVRRSDLVARYGGDEFVVLMPETTAVQAYQLGDKLRQWLANDPLLREKKITASIGIATYPQHATTPQELIQIADASMYLAKHQGGNSVVSADHYRISEQKQWQRHVLEAYLGVTIKRLFATGPEAFDEVYHRLEQVVDSLGAPGEWQELPTPVLETVTSLAFAIDAKDHYTQGHSQNVARYCLLLARHLNLPEKEVEEVRLAAVLHDVGKIGVPERLLNKPGPLDAEEFEQMKQHSVLGAKILEPLRSIQNIQKIVRHHHERWDGSGYPDGLKADAIPLASRMIGIADAYDTMVTERTYKRSRNRQEAYEELRRCAGAQFDPRLVDAFLDVMGAEVIAEEPQPPATRT
jgi:diguanylate cyclase (GGDEF)-like protein/putative nucleotidyltransferase with HDIG domain